MKIPTFFGAVQPFSWLEIQPSFLLKLQNIGRFRGLNTNGNGNLLALQMMSNVCPFVKLAPEKHRRCLCGWLPLELRI
ncbi:hypothetical protein V6N13_147301 [Hibiscus sabdariffa]